MPWSAIDDIVRPLYAAEPARWRTENRARRNKAVTLAVAQLAGAGLKIPPVTADASGNLSGVAFHPGGYGPDLVGFDVQATLGGHEATISLTLDLNRGSMAVVDVSNDKAPHQADVIAAALKKALPNSSAS